MASVNKIKKFGVEYDIEDIRANPENIIAAVNNAINSGEIQVGNVTNADFLYNQEKGYFNDSVTAEQFEILKNSYIISVNKHFLPEFSEITFIKVADAVTDGEGIAFISLYTDMGNSPTISTLFISNNYGVEYLDYHEIQVAGEPLEFGKTTTMPWRIITPIEQSEQQYQYPFEGPGIYTIELCDSEQYGRVYTATLVVPVSYQATCFKTFYSTPIVASTTGCLKLYPVVDGDIVTNNWLSWADISFPANPTKIRIIKIATLPQTIL